MTVATVEVSAESGLLRISLSGEIDLANAAAVEQEIFAAVADQPTSVSVNLTDVSYMDSVGLRILFDLASHLKESGIVLELIAPLHSPARQLVEISGFESFATLRK